MPKGIRTEIVINAPAEEVWRVLTDFAAYPQWNPFIRSITGDLTPGARLNVCLQPSGGRTMSFRPTVLKVEPNRELRWLGHVLIRGIFDGEHMFILEPITPNRTRFIQQEAFTGVFLPLMAGTLDTATRGSFREMNEALKKRVEKGAQ